MFYHLNKPYLPSINGSVIRSIQRVDITIPTGATSATATISSVTLANTRLFYRGWNASIGMTNAKSFARAELTNTTTVTAYRNTSDGTGTVTIGVDVVEFISGVISTMRRGTISMAGAAGSQTAAVTGLTSTSAEVAYLGQISADTGTNISNVYARVQRDSDTQISVSRLDVSGTCVVGYEAVNYSSTYMVTASNVTRTYGANDAIIYTDEYTSRFDYANQLMASWGGQRMANSTDLQNDLVALTMFTNKGSLLQRDVGNANSGSFTSYNVMIWQPGILKRRMMYGNGSIANAASTGSITLPGGITVAKVATNFLGHRAGSSMDRATETYDNSMCRVSFDAVDTVDFYRGGTSGILKPCVGVWEFY